MSHKSHDRIFNFKRSSPSSFRWRHTWVVITLVRSFDVVLTTGTHIFTLTRRLYEKMKSCNSFHYTWGLRLRSAFIFAPSLKWLSSRTVTEACWKSWCLNSHLRSEEKTWHSQLQVAVKGGIRLIPSSSNTEALNCSYKKYNFLILNKKLIAAVFDNLHYTQQSVIPFRETLGCINVEIFKQK